MNISFASATLPKSGVLILLVPEGSRLDGLPAEADRRTEGQIGRAIAAAGFTGKRDTTLDLVALAPWDDGGAPPSESEYDSIVAADEQPSLALLPPTISVAREMSAPSGRRFYLSSIVGGSFMVVSPDNTPASCLTGGGAAGVALERSNGRIRLEAEGRYRGLL
jgi:hypothetical protein